jgi:hypothetical protein
VGIGFCGSDADCSAEVAPFCVCGRCQTAAS